MLFIGVDPGVSGGLAVIDSSVIPRKVSSIKMPPIEREIWDWLEEWGYGTDCFALIEQQIPRPTYWPENNNMKSSLLKSTCILYGNYMLIKGMLTGANISYEDIPPKRWQALLKIPSRKKGESNTDHKNRLKSRASQIFPNVRVTLSNCDALLLALTAERIYQGVMTTKERH